MLLTRTITTKDGEIIRHVIVDEVQPENKNRTTGRTEDGMPVIYQCGRGWMDTIIADNSMFFNWE